RDERLGKMEGRDPEVAKRGRRAEAGQEVEQVGDGRGDLGIAREETEVLVGPCGRGVVVAGPDMRVPVKLAAFAPDDECRFRVDLEIREPVDDMNACL